jgi:hypothetical protein
MTAAEITYRPLDKLNINELRELVLVQINPFRMKERMLEYLRKAQDEYFKRLEAEFKK